MDKVMLKGNERINGGEVILRKPNAGIKNNAVVKAEVVEVVDGKPYVVLKQSLFMIELLPHCIKSHPWGTTPVSQALNLLDPEEYDDLVDGLNSLIVKSAELKKKSKIPSDHQDKVEVGK